MRSHALVHEPPAIRAETLRVGGLRVRVLRAAAEAPRDDPVLLVHGLGGWSEVWQEVMPGIAASGRDAIAFDLPGFGQSERARRPRYFDPEEPFYAAFVHELAEAAGASAFHLVGHSLGGAIAYTAAVWRAERVRSLTLVSPGGLGPELARELRLLTFPGLGLIARYLRSDAASRAVLFACFHDPARCPPHLIDEVVRYGAATLREAIDVLRAAVTLRGVRESVRRPWIERAGLYRGPALVLWGREDAIIPAAHAAAARELVPQAEVRVLERCGHLVQAERPDDFLEALLPFIETARPAG